LTILNEDGLEERRSIPADQYPLICPGFQLPPPSFPRDQRPVSQFTGHAVCGYSPQEIGALFPDAAGVVVKARGSDFVRFLAKIAHSYICADFRDVTIKPYLTEFVLGKPAAVAHLIGGDGSPKQPEDSHLSHNIHRIDVNLNDKRYVGVSIRLFSNLRTPRYHVIVGEAV
jgi:hypothetical protein